MIWPLLGATALFVAAMAVRIARPPVEPFRWRTVAVTITADTTAFVAAMRAASTSAEEFGRSIARVNAVVASVGVAAAALRAQTFTTSEETP